MNRIIQYFQSGQGIFILFLLYSCETNTKPGGQPNQPIPSSIDKSLHTGDIVFQTSKSDQSKAIQLATNSEYSHCGVLFEENGELFVFEAVQPVKMTKLKTWISRGKNGVFKAKRLINADSILTMDVQKKMNSLKKKWIGKNYDAAFNWSNKEMYCSELVWKLFKESAGIETGQLQRLRDFDLSSAIVKKKLKERYGKEIPLDEQVISPAGIFNSGALVDVHL